MSTYDTFPHDEHNDEFAPYGMSVREEQKPIALDPFSEGDFSDEDLKQPETFDRVRETLENGFESTKQHATELSERGMYVLAQMKGDILGQTGINQSEQDRQLEIFDNFEEMTKTIASIGANIDGARNDAEDTLTMYESLGEILSAEEMEERYRSIFTSYGKSFVEYAEIVSKLEEFEKKLAV